LIADVVTGKLDVREVARRLPDDDDDNEPLDGADTSIEDEEMTGGDLDAIAMDGENG
jgi:hypothetical protein